ncbi:MAG TPA: DUF6596 domain-containing protein, partial [Puia sp.]|nr:DUF6596 domain-containing protein [Puia sp.]
FSEGYYSSTHTRILRKDLCLEALRLGLMLIDCPLTNTPKTNALVALMCFHASRFEARQGNGEEGLILYDDQSEERWDKDLITRGHHFLEAAAHGDEISPYHLEAGIAFWHCQKKDTPEKWQRILQYYDLLLKINYSPTVALNRIYALYKVRGREMALAEAEKLQWMNNHFYYTLLGELYKGLDDRKAKAGYEKALALARTEADRQILQQAIEKLEK